MENTHTHTHITHLKAAVRLQWRDSMAQHGRLVILCTEALPHTASPTLKTTSALGVRTQEVVSGWVGGGGHRTMTAELTMTAVFQCNVSPSTTSHFGPITNSGSTTFSCAHAFCTGTIYTLKKKKKKKIPPIQVFFFYLVASSSRSLVN